MADVPVALLVGSNHGDELDLPLRHAVSDAARVPILDRGGWVVRGTAGAMLEPAVGGDMRLTPRLEVATGPALAW